MLTAYSFTYGLLNPVLAVIVSCSGTFLGLRCAVRARARRGAARARWLLLGGVAIGATGIWAMQFIALLGFTIAGETIYYNMLETSLSLLVAVVAVCAGLLIVGFGREGYGSLVIGGVITGLGVAAMRYLEIMAMRMPAKVSYVPSMLAVSVVLSIVAAAAVLWASVRAQRAWTTLIVSLAVAVAFGVMHYAGMAALHVRRPIGIPGMFMGSSGSVTAGSFLVPLILEIGIVTFLVAAAIALSPNADEIRYDTDLLTHIRRQAPHTGARANRTSVVLRPPPPRNGHAAERAFGNGHTPEQPLRGGGAHQRPLALGSAALGNGALGSAVLGNGAPGSSRTAGLASRNGVVTRSSPPWIFDKLQPREPPR